MEDVQTSEDESARSENETEFDKEIDQDENGNPQLADALSKVIRMAKSKNGKSIVLSKAKLYSPKPVVKKTHGFEVEPGPNGEIKTEEKPDVKLDLEDIKPSKKELKKFKITKQERLQRGRLKPSPLDREKERPLVKIATKGVVQLFNAVQQQQSSINKQINKPGVTEVKKDKILKSIDKKAFLDVLMGKGKSEKDLDLKHEPVNDLDDVVKTESEEAPSWEVLRDDFMMGAKLKDWDKKEMEILEQ